MSLAKAASFLANRERAGELTAGEASAAQDPVFRLTKALRQQSVMPLADIAGASGVSAEQVLPLVQRMISDGVATILERPDREGERFLSLTSRAEV